MYITQEFPYSLFYLLRPETWVSASSLRNSVVPWSTAWEASFTPTTFVAPFGQSKWRRERQCGWPCKQERQVRTTQPITICDLRYLESGPFRSQEGIPNLVLESNANSGDSNLPLWKRGQPSAIDVTVIFPYRPHSLTAVTHKPCPSRRTGSGPTPFPSLYPLLHCFLPFLRFL